jgi:hypothetical protein
MSSSFPRPAREHLAQGIRPATVDTCELLTTSRHFLIPIEVVSYVGGGFVKTELNKEQVHGGPELDPDIRLHPELRAEIHEYYGYPTPG